jgi:hypothetical protein
LSSKWVVRHSATRVLIAEEIVMYGELEGIGNESVVAYFKIVFVAEENR